MKDLEKSIMEEFNRDTDYAVNTTDDELFKRAATTANNQQGSKDLLALGMASIWVVFVSIFMKTLKPVFKSMAKNTKTTSTNTTNTGIK